MAGSKPLYDDVNVWFDISLDQIDAIEDLVFQFGACKKLVYQEDMTLLASFERKEYVIIYPNGHACYD